MNYEDDFNYFLIKDGKKNLSLLESIIYYYVFLFNNENHVEKMICFHDENYEFKEEENLTKKLHDVEIFTSPISYKNKCIFHITHNKKITEIDKEILNDFLSNKNVNKYKLFNDEYCPYSITFEIEI